MTQRFLVIGEKAYRDAMDAVRDPKFAPGCPIAEFDTTARVNDFYAVTKWHKGEDGALQARERIYVRVFEELEKALAPGELLEVQKIFVFPYLERKAGARDAA